MIAGADAIDDLDLLRCGGMGELFDGVRAPSTLGSFCARSSWGNVRQLEAVSRRLLAELAARDPGPARRRPDGGCGHRLDAAAGVRAREAGRRVRPCQGRRVLGAAARAEPADRGDLHPDQRTAGGRDPATRRDRRPRPAARPRSWPKRSAPPGPPAPPGCSMVRMDSAFYNAATIAACRRGGARFSVTARMDPKIRQDHRGRSPITPGWVSATRRRSGTTTSNGGSPTPRSPRSTTPRSPATRSRRSPPD